VRPPWKAGASPDLDAIFLRLDPSDIAFVKFVLESYEGVGVVRTLDRHEAVIVLLAGRDFRWLADAILRSLADSVSFEQIEPPDAAGDDWLLRILWGGE
jgi:hypothetical protein